MAHRTRSLRRGRGPAVEGGADEGGADEGGADEGGAVEGGAVEGGAVVPTAAVSRGRRADRCDEDLPQFPSTGMLGKL